MYLDSQMNVRSVHKSLKIEINVMVKGHQNNLYTSLSIYIFYIFYTVQMFLIVTLSGLNGELYFQFLYSHPHYRLVQVPLIEVQMSLKQHV